MKNEKKCKTKCLTNVKEKIKKKIKRKKVEVNQMNECNKQNSRYEKLFIWMTSFKILSMKNVFFFFVYVAFFF
jgi:hypothetical protein